MSLWQMTSLKSVEQASRLETQAGVHAVGLRQNFFFSGKPPFLFFRPPTNWMRPTCITEGKILHLKNYKLIVDINKIPSQQHLD